MNIYRMIGNKVATPDALELAERLSAWHDAMVSHQRLRRRDCDDECPHELAPALWREAAQVFGPHVREFAFLESHGTGRPVRRPSPGALA